MPSFLSTHYIDAPGKGNNPAGVRVEHGGYTVEPGDSIDLPDRAYFIGDDGSIRRLGHIRARKKDRKRARAIARRRVDAALAEAVCVE